jgi:hypothetical protein
MMDLISHMSKRPQAAKNETMHTHHSGLMRTEIDGELFYCISNFDQMRPFLMNIVSESNIWMFVSSRGGLSAGRKSADQAIFPYYTDDKITELSDVTGSFSLFRIKEKGKSDILWQPFNDGFGTKTGVTRNIYKSIYNNKIVFEEILESEDLCFRYGWYNADTYGIVRKASLSYTGSKDIEIEMLDGVLNILPAGVGQVLQTLRSNLVNAYRKNELLTDSGLGIYSLSANIIDKPEPSESLQATIAWAAGLQQPTVLLSTLQINAFRRGLAIQPETDIRAETGAYLLHKNIRPDAAKPISWIIVLDTNQGVEDIVARKKELHTSTNIIQAVEKNIESGTKQLHHYLQSSDGIQLSNDHLSAARHLSNVLFNIMRGGLLTDGHQIPIADFCNYLHDHNQVVAEKYTPLFSKVPESLERLAFIRLCAETNDLSLIRLAEEYLPLFFSRRHGDPSRPWNAFNINSKEADGSRKLDYEGNWRDIFQNWEALALSFPGFIDSMIARFLNATTADGYNPYRITRNGIDWEIIEHNDPWSFIGYWGDHQIVYLLKLLELSEKFHPGTLSTQLNTKFYSFANVPYRIQPFDAILKNPSDTIHFDEEEEARIQERVAKMGSDGKLLWNRENEIIHVTLGEKLLIPLFAKLSNYIHEGGIWLNTQRPEWNDANNALVGNGVSMVTLFYIRRYIHFIQPVLKETPVLQLSSEVKGWMDELKDTFQQYQVHLNGPMDDAIRMAMIHRLGHAAQHYNQQVYAGLSGYASKTGANTLQEFLNLILQFIDHTISVNKRNDELYESYNLLELDEKGNAHIAHMYLMLEGQVAALSSGAVSPEEAVNLLDALKKSQLFRADQYSYLLYPDRELKRFVDKNTLEAKQLDHNHFLKTLALEQHNGLIELDTEGNYHFHKSIQNARNIDNWIKERSATDPVNEADKAAILQLFEETFQHKSFTGRSGTFYGYEGLNCIYWHMVSKLLLAVQEQIKTAYEINADKATIGRLVEHYYEIRAGIGLNKTPELYGAFPTDPYSHTPGNKGAQQPGMTGQVKEDIITRFGELGIDILNGQIVCSGNLLRAAEFIPTDGAESYIQFSFCSTTFRYVLADKQEYIRIHDTSGNIEEISGLTLSLQASKHIINRDRVIDMVEIHIIPRLA